jgi:hypothetical protein
VVGGRVDLQRAAEPDDAGAFCWGPVQQPGRVAAGSHLGVADGVDMLAGVVAEEGNLAVEDMAGRNCGMSEECSCEAVYWRAEGVPEADAAQAKDTGRGQYG